MENNLMEDQNPDNLNPQSSINTNQVQPPNPVVNNLVNVENNPQKNKTKMSTVILASLAILTIAGSLIMFFLTESASSLTPALTALIVLPLLASRQRVMKKIDNDPVARTNYLKIRKMLYIITAVFTVLAIALLAFIVLQKDSNDTQSPKSSNNTSSAENPATIEIDNRGTYSLQEPSEMTTFYDQIEDPQTGKVIDNKDVFLTVQHPADWPVYKLERYQDQFDPDAAVFIKSPRGHYMHIFDRPNVGGTCDSNNETYTLIKKIPTKTDNLFPAYVTAWGPNISVAEINHHNSNCSIIKSQTGASIGTAFTFFQGKMTG